ncbi:MAG TPA: hypothetical protein VGK58_03525 [Lacipirellulaceae bacterium]
MALSAKRLIITTAIGLVALAATLVAASLILNPWRRSDASIRARLLAVTPQGSGRAEVQAILQQKGWLGPPATQWSSDPNKFAARVGAYQGLPWYTNVYAIWLFDSNGQLKDIKIDRVLDSP